MIRTLLKGAVALACVAVLVVSAMLSTSFLMSVAALAQVATPDTTIDIPIGEWIAVAGEWAAPLLLAVAMWLIRKLPAQIVAILMTARVDQLLERGIDYAINATANATKGRALSIDVGSEVVEKAVQYAIDNAPGWMISWMGGPELIRKKVIARLEVEPDVALK